MTTSPCWVQEKSTFLLRIPHADAAVTPLWDRTNCSPTSRLLFRDARRHFPEGRAPAFGKGVKAPERDPAFTPTPPRWRRAHLRSRVLTTAEPPTEGTGLLSYGLKERARCPHGNPIQSSLWARTAFLFVPLHSSGFIRFTG